MTSLPSRLPWPMIVQVLGVAAAVWLVLATWQVWVLLFTALIIAAAILPAARAGERHGIPRGLVVLSIDVSVVAVFSLMGACSGRRSASSGGSSSISCRAGILLGNAMRLTTGAVGSAFEVLAVLVVAT